MTDVLELIADIKTPDKRREVVEYINAHPDEFGDIIDSVFTGTSDDKVQSKLHILDLIDFLSAKLAVKVIERVIVDSDSRIKMRGLQAAYRIRIDSLNPQLVDILADQEEEFEVRKWVVHILGSTDSAGYGRILRKTARDIHEDVNLRKEAVFALTKVPDDETLGTLCALLGDSNVEMRESGAWALSNMSAPESINCLLAALEDESEVVRDWVIRGLRDMDDAKALQGLADVMARVSSNEQVRMIRLVVERKSEIILRAITELLSSEDVEVLRVAAWAIGVSPYPPAVPVLRDLLEHEDEQVRDYAKVALVSSGGIDTSDFQL
ncbi:MAG: HEAT repeat domain-containing protein [Candidatus Thorarchaeota archaeon]|nr:HEAT repeat domain-containing protein [Candidatus Thorarchaeota archaeon]